MGIRFHCSNGHHLNVKSFLAGKRGYCPHCGIKLRIPLESEVNLQSRSNGKPASALSAGHRQATVAAAAPAGSSPAEESWYVRPPSGGQFGPATSDVINQWIAQRRVPPNSLIWREGWTDWQAASEVLNEDGLIADVKADAFDDIPNLGLDGDGGITIATDADASVERKPRSRNKVRAKAAVFLGLAALVLLATLLLITSSRS